MEDFDQFLRWKYDFKNFAVDLISRVSNLTRFHEFKFRENAEFNLAKLIPIKVFTGVTATVTVKLIQFTSFSRLQNDEYPQGQKKLADDMGCPWLPSY